MADPEDGRMDGDHLDEGVIHAWLDGQLSTAEATRIEAHIAGCADCAALVAEARGFVAASSRILTGLDGVPARVVPRSRSRDRVWQVRAAAAVIVVALGAAAVLSDTGGRFYGARRETGVSHRPAAASPAPAAAKTADTVAATPPTPASTLLPSAALAKPRAAVPAPAPQQLPPQQLQPQQLQESKKETAFNERDGVAQAGAIRKPAQPPSSDAARVPPTAAQAATLMDHAVPPGRQDTLAAAPASVMRSALAAKTAPSGVGGYAAQQPAADSSAPAGVARAFSVRRLVSNAAYRQCAGKVVTVSEPAGMAADTVAHLTTVRLDSAAQSPPIRGFVLAAPGARANLDGWWVPVGADSAVVSLANPGVSGAGAADSAARDTSGAAPFTVTRVHCLSP